MAAQIPKNDPIKPIVEAWKRDVGNDNPSPPKR